MEGKMSINHIPGDNGVSGRGSILKRVSCVYFTCFSSGLHFSFLFSFLLRYFVYMIPPKTFSPTLFGINSTISSIYYGVLLLF